MKSREVPYLGTINMFSQWRQNVKSLYFKVVTLPHFLPLTFQFTMSLWSSPPRVLHVFAPYSPGHNLQQLKYSKTLAVYMLLTGLCAGCFCTVCQGWKCGRERIWLVSMQAVSIATNQRKHTDVYHQDINYNCLYFIILYLQQTMLPIRSLAQCTLEHNANNTHIMCITGICKVCKSKPN